MSFMVNSTCYADTVYDFSDEAQAKFDSQEYIIINNTPDGLSIETQKKEKKKRRKKENIEKTDNVSTSVDMNNSQVQGVQQQETLPDFSVQDKSVFEPQNKILKPALTIFQ